MFYIPGADPMADMLQLIKQGVKLKPVREDANVQTGKGVNATPSDRHTQQLKEVLDRISHRLNQESDDEEDNCSHDNYDDF